MFDEGAFDRDFVDYMARQTYKELQEKDPENPLLKFARIKKRGFWIFSSEQLELIPELSDEFREKYRPKHGRYPLPFESYYREMKEVLGEKVGDFW